jgi:hypothetical protein
MRQRGASETSDFPILFEIPDYAENKLESRHWSGMGYSITLNSSLKSLKSGSTFPMTQAIIEKIGEIKMRYAKP